MEIRQEDDIMDHNSRDWDNLGIMLCAHKGYTLGDEQFNSREALDERLEELDNEQKIIIKFPIWLLDHSGLWMQIGSFDSDAQQWDSGQVGWIVATKKGILDCFTGYIKDPKTGLRNKRQKMKTKLTDKMIIDAEKILRSEVETYSKDLSGEVYGYAIKERDVCSKCKNVEYETVDSCWGFYSMDDIWDAVGNKEKWKEQNVHLGTLRCP